MTSRLLANASSRIANMAGRPKTFAAAALSVIAWAVIGPLLHFVDISQHVLNILSIIVTFRMVFLIQNAQNRDSEAMHAKLDTLLATLVAADNRHIGVERRPDQEIEAMRTEFGPQPGPGEAERSGRGGAR